ncbi:MAG TPA: MmcQ/YjbR family DNA-binding protein [Gemmataceae bacterium]|nr:MmcQ/YjbR family DNA-binding protein [Gemmataceae bacterium]
MAKKDRSAQVEASLRTAALGYPGAVEDFPWGERAIKVNGKMFFVMSRHESVFRVTAKLPLSNAQAVALPFVEPTGYGLGKHGWVTASFSAGDDVPEEMLLEWIDESFRAVAPKKVVASMDAVAPDERKPKPRRKRE